MSDLLRKMNDNIWIGHEHLLKEPCRAVFVNDGQIMYLLEEKEQEMEDGSKVRKAFDLPRDQAVSLAKWILKQTDGG